MQPTIRGNEPVRNPIPPEALPISILDVWITRNAQITVGLAAKEMAAYLGLDEAEIRQSLGGKVWYHPESEELCLVLETKDERVEAMFVVIPAGEWGFRREAAEQ